MESLSSGRFYGSPGNVINTWEISMNDFLWTFFSVIKISFLITISPFIRMFQNEMKICKQCGKIVKLGVFTCPACGGIDFDDLSLETNKCLYKAELELK